VVSYLTPLTGLTADLLNAHGMPLAQALATLRAGLPRDAVLVGQNIRADVQWLGLKEGTDFAGMLDLAGLWRCWNAQYKSWSVFGQDHLARVLLGVDSAQCAPCGGWRQQRARVRGCSTAHARFVHACTPRLVAARAHCAQRAGGAQGGAQRCDGRRQVDAAVQPAQPPARRPRAAGGGADGAAVHAADAVLRKAQPGVRRVLHGQQTDMCVRRAILLLSAATGRGARWRQ
jgi:hypothetical protein